MQPRQSSRIDLAELKAQMIKKVGVDKFKRYSYYLERFISHKLSKPQFDNFCCRILGRENVPLHNHLFRSMLMNICRAKTPPPIQPPGPPRFGTHVTNTSPGREDGHESNGVTLQNHNQNATIWSNGVLPVSPRKIRPGTWKHRDRPSPLGPNGKVDSISHQSLGTEDSGSKGDMENGTLTPCDYQRPVQLQAVAELPEDERGDAAQQPANKPRIHGKEVTEALIAEGEEVEHSNYLSFSRSTLLAPLGIPYFPASVGGARKALPVASTGDFVSCYDSGRLSDPDTLRRRMEQIAAVQGLGGVSTECAHMLNNLLDVYLKRLITSCVNLVGVRSMNELRKPPVQKQQVQGKVINGMWSSNHFHVQSVGGASEAVPEHIPPLPHSVSLLDFRAAMELNPQQLGEDWPLLLEKISMHAFEE
ncbi:hypothetical protein QN277_015136 [Acacia crassicarpa]|uniref:Transcriptional coactivator Hfi1/Transcriptional adapter 1 n=1 Tax=Acacia crassicarpa TaxID=499986 RepID=A0AAE1KJV3_9FABA|nr:hypothetical protein QN277_015136 [Acacia crassicarpa]